MKSIFTGNNRLIHHNKIPKGRIVEMDGEKYYRIRHYQNMPDFFISVISHTDHWMFISSNGALTAGRKNKDNSLFPYYTEDKIHDYRGKTGSKTLILTHLPDKTFFWEPFSEHAGKHYQITRSISKSLYGNKILFEEENHELGLVFTYRWCFSERYGIVRQSEIRSVGPDLIRVNVLDGIMNIMPSGIDYAFQNEYSNLLNAYKKTERVEGTSLALFSVSSIPVDKAEPSESLRATAVWAYGLNEGDNILLSEDQLQHFSTGGRLRKEWDLRAKRGAYLIQSEHILKSNAKQSWGIVAEINLDTTEVANLRYHLSAHKELEKKVGRDIEKGTQQLRAMLSQADGFQTTAQEMSTSRHYFNVLYNIMRGGTFRDPYDIHLADFRKYLLEVNPMLSKQLEESFCKWEAVMKLPVFLEKAASAGQDDLLRIAYGYLPLTFSRRHGDPSRPWNYFSIETKDEQGKPKLYYEGNWRDIFQNWEALAYSFPGFIEGMICKFVNASTIDGNNPYRITRSGIDWEVPDERDPWAHIGYWGDHQIIYLQKLIELSRCFHPGKFEQLLQKEIFVYANVPYRIKAYSEILRDSKDTVIFDQELNASIRAQTKNRGTDASLVYLAGCETPYRVSLAEKLIVTLLNKLGNFIPGAGIWLNTQRPEWNDANNALVGNGASMVTLYYLRRYLGFLQQTFLSLKGQELRFSTEVALLFQQIYAILSQRKELLFKRLSDVQRRWIADELGTAISDYRWNIYENAFSGKKESLDVSSLLDFIRYSIYHLDHTISLNRREDQLFHAYNLIRIEKDSISIRPLYEMLEGQVAVLSSGFLSPEESLKVLEALKESKMYRPDQDSYVLYPDRDLPLFVEKNNIPEARVFASKLLPRLLEEGDESIIKKDAFGEYHFSGAFRNVNALSDALENLEKNRFGSLVEKERPYLFDLFEEVFDHQSFTGRSGSFFGYEGLGSIYWHMVSKLLLATQECFYKALENGTAAEVIHKLKAHYYEIRAGIGANKEPGQYGSFPTDAYSHTPANSGVKQPGLTGQVKEDVISRIGELGVRIHFGRLRFDAALLDRTEILQQEAEMVFIDENKKETKIRLKKDQIGFTFCHVPVVYDFSGGEGISISYRDGSIRNIQGHILDQETSSLLFGREGSILRIEVGFSLKEDKDDPK